MESSLKAKILEALPIPVADGLRRIKRRSRYLTTPKMMQTLQLLQSRGFSPSLIIDVGAAQGEWTRSARPIFGESKFLMVEPNPIFREKLQKVAAWAGADYLEAGLGAEEGTLPLLLPDDPAGSSFIGDGGGGYFKDSLTVPVRTLESVLNGRAAGLIKLDVQGYELEVLKGAASRLADTEVVIAECSLYEFHEGIPLLHDVIEWMESRDFLAYEFTQAYRLPNGQLAQVDVMFVSKNSPLRQWKPS